MLVMPALPHHHHHDGIVCMKSDVTNHCGEEGNQHASGNCVSGDGCITLDESVTPSHHPELTVDPCTIVLFILPLQKLLSLIDDFSPTYVYIESLHSAFIISATGLRAPPSFVA